MAAPAGPPESLVVGYITKAFGLAGEVLVHLVTNREERMRPGTVLSSARGHHEVVRSAKHGDRWRVTFAGCDDRNHAEALRGTELSAPPLVDADALWVHELVGSRVVLPDGSSVGAVAAVEANPASDLLVLVDGRLIPLVFVRSSADGVVVIDPPEGLLDLE